MSDVMSSLQATQVVLAPTGEGKNISHSDALSNTTAKHCSLDILEYGPQLQQTSAVETSNIRISFLQHKSIRQIAMQKGWYISGSIDCLHAVRIFCEPARGGFPVQQAQLHLQKTLPGVHIASSEALNVI
jgi:hypothetical protein